MTVPAINIFQSTPPARGATLSWGACLGLLANFNPRPPRGGRRCRGARVSVCWQISIHAPREGGDGDNIADMRSKVNFNPRPPRGGRRDITVFELEEFDISIHAPREGGDVRERRKTGWGQGISIHAPREGGDCSSRTTHGHEHVFQSTPPARGATRCERSLFGL